MDTKFRRLSLANLGLDSSNRKHSTCWRFRVGLVLAFILSLTTACKHGPLHSGEYGYVAVPQAVLRDHVAAIYNKVGTVNNGDKVEILDHQKRFVKVRSSSGQEGWIEQRYLVGEDIFNGFEKLAKENAATPAQAHGITRVELNMHLTPARDSEKLYQLSDTEKVDILKRATTPKETPPQAKGNPSGDKSMRPPRKPGSPQASAKNAPQKPAKPEAASAGNVEPKTEQPKTDESKPDQPKPMDDWWLVRNKQGRVGWVLARMIDMDVPMEIAQYAEGQRIQACFVLNQVQDEDKKVAQYLVLLTQPKDGLPFDFDGFRIFTWNLRRHRYETAYRERNIAGFLPASTATQTFGKEGAEPTFTLRLQNADGAIADRTYRLEGPLVKRVLAPGEQSEKLASTRKDTKKQQKQTARRHSAH